MIQKMHTLAKLNFSFKKKGLRGNKVDIDNYMKLLLGSDNNKAYNALKILLEMSENSNVLYSYFDQFIEMMNNQDNSYIRTRGLHLIACNSKWDENNRINAIIDQWLKHIEDEKPITARQCIKDTVIIAKNKLELLDIILDALANYHKVYKDSMQKIIYQDRQNAIREIRQYTW